jgi:hypothetical protein
MTLWGDLKMERPLLIILLRLACEGDRAAYGVILRTLGTSLSNATDRQLRSHVELKYGRPSLGFLPCCVALFDSS